MVAITESNLKLVTKLGRAIDTALDWLAIGMAAIGGAALVIMMLVMFADGIGRKIVSSIPGAWETSIALMVVVGLLSFGYTQMRRAHVSVTLFSDRLPKRTQSILIGVGALLGVGVFSLLTWLSWDQAWNATLKGEFWLGTIVYPKWPFRWALPIGAGNLALQFLRTAIIEFRKGLGQE